ncbi:uncharacterized protein Dere_GG19504 [Drosophila erecta]|uniref:Chitin-binding type-2 domain-containing protein n=1 Tax=Drosophila erecta TaxID=7220 RepID=A0A0Q5TBW4_DROER|nr:uncharacterized protein Dere_GG19504 [Drosophila erecta]
MRVYHLLLIGLALAAIAGGREALAQPPRAETPPCTPPPDPCTTTTCPPPPPPPPPCTTTTCPPPPPPPCTTTTCPPPCTTTTCPPPPPPPCITTTCPPPPPPPCTTTCTPPCTPPCTTTCTPPCLTTPSADKEEDNSQGNEKPSEPAAPINAKVLISRHDCRGQDDGTFLADVRHCRRYYVCNRQRSRRQNCPTGFWFDRELKACRLASLVGNCDAMRN